LVVDNYVASITQVPQDNVTAEEDHGCCWYRLECLPKSIRDVLRSILDTSTFSSPTFVVLSISSFLTMMGEVYLRIISRLVEHFLSDNFIYKFSVKFTTWSFLLLLDLMKQLDLVCI